MTDLRDGVGGAARGKERPSVGSSPAPSTTRKKQLRKMLRRLDRELHYWNCESVLAMIRRAGCAVPAAYAKDVRRIEKMDAKRKAVRLELKRKGANNGERRES
jgi:hypothetical protein